MASQIPYEDGDQVFIEMFLKNAKKVQGAEQETADGLPLNVMGSPVSDGHIMDFQFVESLGKAGTFSLKLYDQNFDALENKIFAGGALEPSNKRKTSNLPVISVRWGWVNGERKIESPTWDMRITKYNSRFTFGHGTELELEGVAAPGLLHKTGKTRSAGPGSASGILRLSDLVKQIANDSGMDTDVEDGDINLHVRNTGKNDLTWLKNIANYAVTADSGNKKYEVWVRKKSTGAQQLVVRTQKQPEGAQTWDYLHGIDRDGTILEYETTINSNILFALGGGGFKTVVLDPKTKDFTTVYTDETTVGAVYGEGKMIPNASDTKRPLRSGFQSKEAAEAFAAAKYLALNSTNVTSTLKVHGNPIISPGDLVNVVVQRRANQIENISDVHPSSGSYNIKTITHIISNGSYTTEAELFRRGNLTAGAGGSKNTTGTEAASNAVKQASDLQNSKTFKTAKHQKRSRDETIKNEALLKKRGIPLQ